MVVLIEIPFFLSLFVSFYKECLILKRNDFVLIIFQTLFQRWLITTCCKLWLLLGLVLNKFRKKIKKDSIIPRLEIYWPVFIFDQNLQCYSTSIVLTTSVHRIFKEGVPGNLRIMTTKRKISPLRISPFSCPKLGEDRKKKVISQILSVFVLKLSVQITNRGACRNFAYYSMLIILYWRPKGSGHGTMSPLNTPLVLTCRTSNIVCMR